MNDLYLLPTEKFPSNLRGLSDEIIEMKAQEIASESFIKNGNNGVCWTANNELRILVGGRYDSYPEVSKFVILAYTNKQADLIISNL